jgi:hypothetical protein
VSSGVQRIDQGQTQSHKDEEWTVRSGYGLLLWTLYPREARGYRFGSLIDGLEDRMCFLLLGEGPACLSCKCAASEYCRASEKDLAGNLRRGFCVRWCYQD